MQSVNPAINRHSSGSDRIAVLLLPTQTNADDYVVDFHPSLNTPQSYSGCCCQNP